MGILPNGDLIVISLNKIYSYSFVDKPTSNMNTWKISQIYEIKTPECLLDTTFDCFVYRTKLLLFHNNLVISQFDLLTKTLDKQYFSEFADDLLNVTINKDDTLLALNYETKIDIFSTETGKLIG